MFGGHGFYVDDLFVAIIAFGPPVPEGRRRQRAALRGGRRRERFVYEARGQSNSINYWTVPDEAMESPAAMRPWLRLAMQAALSARAAAPAAGRRPARRPQPSMSHSLPAASHWR